jgi:16S rRNA (adenine1518-N6/adenine1519-N6)-dimethyltransferase
MSVSDLSSLPPLRDVISGHGLAAKKAFGQHFLLDLNVTRKIVRLAGDLSGVHVIEIGPGPGGLTRALVESDAVSVTAIEKDSRCLTALAELQAVSDGRLTVLEGDALDLVPESLTPAPRAIIANLPYNVATPLLIGWLKAGMAYRTLVLMFQKEVADRIVAPVGSDAYGRLSVLCQICADVERVMVLPARAFTPPPKIDSAVVRFTPRPLPDGIVLKDIETLTAAAFGQRRKMLRSSLKSLGGEALLEQAGIDPTARAEEISIDGFCKLALAYKSPITSR